MASCGAMKQGEGYRGTIQHKTNPARPVAGAGVGQYPCAFCQKTFNTLQSAKQHELAVHKKKIAKAMKTLAEQKTKDVFGDIIKEHQ